MGGDVSLTFTGGLFMGLASSLHCAVMCGGVASALMFAFSRPDDQRERRRALLLAQVGRSAGYMLAGGLAAGVGAPVISNLDQGALLATRWAAAAALGWIGLATLGVLPPLRVLDRLVPRVGATFAGVAYGRGRLAAPVLGGLGWACTPCPMVLAAILYAGLTGSAHAGLAVMAGFALGTWPAVTASALGVGRLRDFARRPRMRVLVGASLIAVALASVAAPVVADPVLCAALF